MYVDLYQTKSAEDFGGPEVCLFVLVHAIIFFFKIFNCEVSYLLRK